jgi:hypothetical protein
MSWNVLLHDSTRHIGGRIAKAAKRHMPDDHSGMTPISVTVFDRTFR